MSYWDRKEELAAKAAEHTKLMQAEYKKEITFSVANTIVYGIDAKMPEEYTGACKPNVRVIGCDSVTAVLENVSGKLAVLNFASYKNPGGMFLKGSSAQEESLCHESDLYNILKEFDDSYYAWNRRRLNRALYQNRGLYTPDVVFCRKDRTVMCDVITCAAPNYSAAGRYQRVSREENHRVLSDRIRFVKAMAEDNKIETLILGAYGCGVFGQKPEETAAVFAKVFETSSVRDVIFAILPGRNLDVFRDTFEKK